MLDSCAKIDLERFIWYKKRSILNPSYLFGYERIFNIDVI